MAPKVAPKHPTETAGNPAMAGDARGARGAGAGAGAWAGRGRGARRVTHRASPRKVRNVSRRDIVCPVFLGTPRN
jgi:hypothetical protein